jgi:hypothetical protein
MTIYWCFQLEHIAKRNLYIDQIREEEHLGEITWKIEQFRDSLAKKIKQWQSIPL